MKLAQWKAMLALLVLWVAFVMDWGWIWGVLFILWTIPALTTGRTHLMEEVERRHHPILYWLIVGTWIFFSLFLIVADFLGF